MTAAEKRDLQSRDLISASERLRRQLLEEVEKLEQFVAAVQSVVSERVEGLDDGNQ